MYNTVLKKDHNKPLKKDPNNLLEKDPNKPLEKDPNNQLEEDPNNPLKEDPQYIKEELREHHLKYYNNLIPILKYTNLRYYNETLKICKNITNLNKDSQHIQDFQVIVDQALKEDNLKYYNKILQIYKKIAKSEKDRESIKPIQKLENKIIRLRCHIDSCKKMTDQLYETISKWEDAIFDLLEMVKEKQWCLKQIKEYLNELSIYVDN